MLKNYITIAFRSLVRSKVHSFINILGLGLGIASCLLIGLFIREEWTYDAFHTKADRIYRAWGHENWGENQDFKYSNTPFPLGPTLKENFVEVEEEVRYNPVGTILKAGEQQYTEQITIAGKSFFKVFDFPAVQGSLANALQRPTDAVLTRAAAERLFGTDNPIDKTIQIQLGQQFEEYSVKAVVENPPTNSSFQFSVIISDDNFSKIIDQKTLTSGWFNINPETYVLLRDGVHAEALCTKFPALFKTLLGDDFQRSHYEMMLQPLRDIHLNTEVPAGYAPVSDPWYSYILAGVSILILVVACINFITLSVGRSIRRAREVGIRKVAGAYRNQLIAQFIGEAMLITLLALILGVALAYLNLPLFNNLAGKNLVLQADGFLMLAGGSLLVIIGLFAGSYPAFILAGFKPAVILKGNMKGISGKQGLRKLLVGIQLVLSIFLISSTLIMRNQLHYLQSKNLGFNKEQLMVVPLVVPPADGLSARVSKGFELAERYKLEISKLPGVAGVSASSHDFGNGSWVSVGYTDETKVYRTITMNVIDPEYIPVMDVTMASGRNFNAANGSDKSRGVIVNEAFVRELGWTDAVGKRMPGKNFNDHEIIGVVKDFNFESLYTEVTPLVLVMDPAIVMAGAENININNSPLPKLLVRLRAGTMQESIAKIQNIWESLSDRGEFKFSFVDQTLDKQYRSDQNLGNIIQAAAILAMLIGSMGLYGLASLAMQARTKEISIRKVLGASEQSLLVLLSREYLYLLGGALIVSVPITWYLMHDWLATFKYRVSIGASDFLLAGGLSLIVAVLAIGYETIRSARTQPAQTLKSE